MLKVNEFSDKDIYSIQKCVKKVRDDFDIGNAPLGNNIFKLVESQGIKLIFYPVKTYDGKQSFSAVYVAIRNDNKYFSFIGLNTNRCLDTQIFSVAHELYHHENKSTLHFYRDINNMTDRQEMIAERFAAELLLPFGALENEIKSINNGAISIKNWEYNSLLMLIARLHCDYKLPYKAIVKRLLEVKAITEIQCNDLLKEDCRNKKSTYYTIALSIGGKEFQDLNKSTGQIGVYKEQLEKIIMDYNSGIVDISQLSNSLAIFNRSLSDFGLQEDIDSEELEDLNSIIGENKNEKE